MKIKYFSWLKNITKTDTEIVKETNIMDINTLKDYLCNKHPKLKKYIVNDDIIKFAINSEYAENNDKISSNDEIAIFPPVSGG